MSYWDDFCFTAYQIEYRLGVLRGNEAVKEWWAAVKEKFDNTPGLAFQPFSVGYISHTQSADYDVQFSLLPTPVGNNDDDTGRILNALQLEADAAWTTGQEWAAGIGSYLVDLCVSFVKPDEGTMKAAMADFASARTKLQTAVPANWTDLDVEGWIGTAHDTFGNFIKDLFDLMVQYDNNLALAENWFTAGCAMISQVQRGALPLLKSVNDELDSQLKEWANSQGWPEDRHGFKPWVADLVKVGDDILGFVPAYSEAKDKIEQVVGLTQDAAHLFGVDPSIGGGADDFTVQTATDIYTGLTRVLQDKHVKPLADTMADIASRSQPVRADVAALGQHWYPPQLRDPDTFVWEPSFSHST